MASSNGGEGAEGSRPSTSDSGNSGGGKQDTKALKEQFEAFAKFGDKVRKTSFSGHSFPPPLGMVHKIYRGEHCHTQ